MAGRGLKRPLGGGPGSGSRSEDVAAAAGAWSCAKAAALRRLANDNHGDRGLWGLKEQAKELGRILDRALTQGTNETVLLQGNPPTHRCGDPV